MYCIFCTPTSFRYVVMFHRTIQVLAFNFYSVGSRCLENDANVARAVSVVDRQPFRLYSNVSVLTFKSPSRLSVCNHERICASLAVPLLQKVCLQFQIR